MSNANKRTIAREYAFKFLYKLQLNEFSDLKELCKTNTEEFEDTIDSFEESFLEQDVEHPDNIITPDIKFYSKKIISLIFNEEKRINEALQACYKDRALDKITGTVLLVSACEILFLNEETPSKVAINEGINLSKKFGTKESGAFVNGVLDKLLKENS